jgi:hypothetical protein
MNFITDERGNIIEPVNPLAVRDVGVAQEIEAVTGETVTFQTGAAGFAGTVSLDKGPIMNLIGDKVGSYWKQPKNLRVKSGPRASSGVAQVTAVTETATAATVTITDTGYNLENLFETTVGSRRAIIVLRDSTGDELYGWIGGIAKTSDSYVLDIYNAPSSGAQSWVGTLADYTFNGQLPIFEIYSNETSLVWTTGTILLREVKFEPGADESSFLNGLTNGDFALDYSTRKLYYKKATTGTSDTAAYSVAKAYKTSTTSTSTSNTPSISSDPTALAANSSRIKYVISNLGTNPLYVRLGASASTTVFHICLAGGNANDDGLGASHESDGVCYTGVITIAGTSPRYTVYEATP